LYVLFAEGVAVEASQRDLEQDLDREGKAVDPGETLLGQGVQAMIRRGPGVASQGCQSSKGIVIGRLHRLPSPFRRPDDSVSRSCRFRLSNENLREVELRSAPQGGCPLVRQRGESDVAEPA